MSSYALHRWDALWPDPLRFDPGRFADDAALHQYQWLVRACV